MSYHSTTPLTADQLRESIAACNRQEMAVLRLYRLRVALTPSECHAAYCETHPPVPLTSIRRAITDLTERGLLQKCFNVRPGVYGKPEHVWRINGGDASPLNTPSPTGGDRPLSSTVASGCPVAVKHAHASGELFAGRCDGFWNATRNDNFPSRKA